MTSLVPDDFYCECGRKAVLGGFCMICINEGKGGEDDYSQKPDQAELWNQLFQNILFMITFIVVVGWIGQCVCGYRSGY